MLTLSELLLQILPHYPRLNKFGYPLEKKLEHISQEQKEKRPDLYALCMGYVDPCGLKSYLSSARPKKQLCV